MTGGVSQDATISLYSGNPLLYNTSAGTRWTVYEGFKNILINKHKNTNTQMQRQIHHCYWHQNHQMVQMCPVRANIDVCVQHSRTPYCMLTPAGQCANQNKNHWCGQTTISMPVCHHSCLQAVSIQRKGCQDVKGCSVLQYSFIKAGF